MSSVKVLQGDSREVLKTFSDSSFDSCVCDPPYSLVSIQKRFGKPGQAQAAEGVYRRSSSGFMGKTWDTGETAFDPTFWEEVLRVLKPGGYLLAFGGTRTYHRLTCAIEDAGFEIRDTISWLYGTGFPKSHNQHGDWQGWGTALKPACELITLARKSLIGTVAENVLAHGTGALNIDGCRIRTDGETIHAPQSDPAKRVGVVGTDLGISRSSVGVFQAAQRESAERTRTLGRWPANLIHDGDEEVLSGFPESKSSGGQASLGAFRNGDVYGIGKDIREKRDPGFGDLGSAARFFYCAKASKSERSGSKHPTVKPISLMRYLCRLVTQPGGLVLDPFAGSGTTGVAAQLEGFNCVLIEREAEYIADIERRLQEKPQENSTQSDLPF